MSFLSMLGAASWKEIAETVDWAKGWVGSLLDTLSSVLWVALALVGAAGGIYAVYVGVKMARAESADQREENKKRLINIIVSIVVVIVLIIVFNVFVPMIISSIDSLNAPEVPDNNQSGSNALSSGTAISTMVNTARCFLHI